MNDTNAYMRFGFPARLGAIIIIQNETERQRLKTENKSKIEKNPQALPPPLKTPLKATKETPQTNTKPKATQYSCYITCTFTLKMTRFLCSEIFWQKYCFDVGFLFCYPASERMNAIWKACNTVNDGWDSSDSLNTFYLGLHNIRHLVNTLWLRGKLL